jgi:hypothetical protein
MNYLISGGGHLTVQFYWFVVITFAIAGAAMLVFAKPLERYSQTSWGGFRGPHSARFYRIVGAIWLLISLLLLAPAILTRL